MALARLVCHRAPFDPVPVNGNRSLGVRGPDCEWQESGQWLQVYRRSGAIGSVCSLWA
ncbi:hypothetical protein PMES_02759 [Profundibacterium mesophilum KAUST100406-0324]|uniref:Uncharacterized protein n=1 Tax=Profundibacterium mesophilum KAUST100406-0324 TaxID=1037889 RepID=A0A921NRL7_9RHOB|nr:hypothetical protein PMES_02759 [Profundibacterium mesophilum KAUST100406-0324]